VADEDELVHAANSIIRALSAISSAITVKFLADNWVLVLVALTSGGMLAWPLLRGGAGGMAALSAAQAVQLMNREKAVVIDVSEPAEYAAGHVAGSRNVPVGSIESAKNLPTNKALPLVVVCPNGARASRAVAALKKLGHQSVHVLGGGVKAWREANLPVEKSA
jgi:rhodanese-related sulfurtransferase